VDLRRTRLASGAATLLPIPPTDSRIQTTMKYLHYFPRDEDAALVGEAFRLDEIKTTR
jgi:hypothetical protein